MNTLRGGSTPPTFSPFVFGSLPLVPTVTSSGSQSRDKGKAPASNYTSKANGSLAERSIPNQNRTIGSSPCKSISKETPSLIFEDP